MGIPGVAEHFITISHDIIQSALKQTVGSKANTLIKIIALFYAGSTSTAPHIMGTKGSEDAFKYFLFFGLLPGR